VAALRVAQCPRCAAAAFSGSRVIIQGHGTRLRQQRGPPDPSAPPGCVEIGARRYRCDACGAVITVLPASCQPLKHFSGAAIAAAIALWGLCGKSALEVRRAISDWRVVGSSARGWRSLSRWVVDAVERRLFGGLDLPVPRGTSHEQAARLAQALCGWAPSDRRTAELPGQAFFGAMHVA
jgi:hypothetical protein